MNSYLILAHRMSELSDKLEALNKRAKKLGVPEIETKVLGFVPADRETREPARYEIEVIGGPTKLPGWDFLGTVEHTAAGNVLRAMRGKEIPESFRNAPKICDHCKTKRNRKDTYLVRKEETNEIKQIGHTCIKDFLGHTNPESLAFLATLDYELRELGMEGGGEGFSQARGFEVRDLMGVGAELIIQVGYSKAGSDNGSTGSQAMSEINSREEKRKAGKGYLILVVTKAADELAQKTLDWAMLQTGKEGYLANIQVIATEAVRTGVVDRRNAGLLVSAIQAYKKEMNLIEERKREVKVPSEYVGEIGKRQDFKDLTLFKKMTLDTQYGVSFLLLFKDPAGNMLKWFTATGQGFEEGKVYSLKATVKKHEIYKEIKQTQLTRAQDLEEIAAKKAVAAEEKAGLKALKKAKPGHEWYRDVQFWSGAHSFRCKKCTAPGDGPLLPCKTTNK